MKILILLFLLVAPFLSGATISASVYYKNGVYSLEPKFDNTAAAWGTFIDSLMDIGWGKLYLHTNPTVDDEIQMHAAGFVEGYLTAPHIFNHRKNVFEYQTKRYLNSTDFPPELYQFVNESRTYLLDMVSNFGTHDPYWHQVGLIYNQFEGLVQGYNLGKKAGQELTFTQLWMFEASGDLLDLWHVVKPKDWDSLSPEDQDALRSTSSHCSGLVKLVKDNQELYVAQDAWFFYGAQNRILKSYDFQLGNFNKTTVPSRKMIFSSYPGFLYSFDDFYLLQSRLVVLETTFNIWNNSLFSRCSPRSLHEWIRVMVANRLASNGQEWSDLFAQENSGSYNNQYMIVDYKQFTLYKKPQNGTLWVLEQMPGNVVSRDMTDTLVNQMYFPSFNVPQFDSIYQECGYPEHCAESPYNVFWHDRYNSARAKMFRRDHANVTDMDTMKAIMRYNAWKKDGLSKCPVNGPDPGAAIAARYDLRPESFPERMRVAFGAIDAKVTSAHMVPGLTFNAIAGPVSDKDNGIPFFDFSSLKMWCPHEGVPEKYQFDWILMYPDDPTEDLIYVVILVVGGCIMLTILSIGLCQLIRYKCSKNKYQQLPPQGGINPSHA